MKKMTKTKALATCSVVTIISIVITQFSDQIRTTERGLKVIGNAEGCIAEPYHCPSDVLTVGIGSTQSSVSKKGS